MSAVSVTGVAAHMQCLSKLFLWQTGHLSIKTFKTKMRKWHRCPWNRIEVWYPLRTWMRSVLYFSGVSSARSTCSASRTFPSSRFSRYFCCRSRNFIRWATQEKISQDGSYGGWRRCSEDCALLPPQRWVNASVLSARSGHSQPVRNHR